jgi:hypothetical protein
VAAEGAGRLLARLDAFVARAIREGALRDDVPAEWAREVLRSLTDVAAHATPELSPGPAADLVVKTLDGLGPA